MRERLNGRTGTLELQLDRLHNILIQLCILQWRFKILNGAMNVFIFN